MEAKKYLKKLMILIAVFLFISGGIVVLVDPFFHYHAPLKGMKAVQTKKEYQVNGALEHLDYNAVLLGSSVAMNVNNSELDELYGCKSIKAVGSSASASLLCYYLQKAFDNRNLDYVFWSFDTFSITSDFVEDTTEDQILYLRNKNPIDDIFYIWNMDVLFKEVPRAIIYSFFSEYDEGTSYEFARYSTFGARAALNAFYDLKGARTKRLPYYDAPFISDNVEESVMHIDAIIKQHPDTEFVFFLAPYSILWWDLNRRDGDTMKTMMEISYVVTVLDENENVSFYMGLFNDRETITNLDNYTDWIHASPETYHRNLETIAEGKGLLNAENVDDELSIILDIIDDFEERVDDEGYEFLVEEKYVAN